MTHTDLLALATRLAREAGDAIEAVRRAGFAIERKGDASPVTAADRLAEGIITEGLRLATPEIPVVAEEAFSAGEVPAVQERFWLVDPLDGTKEFAAGLDEYVVCIALIEGGRPVLGVLAAPARGSVYGGIVGTGAWIEEGGQRRPIQARRAPPEGLHLLDSRSHRDAAATEAYCANLSIAETTRMGSALKFAWMAEGKADLMPRLSAGIMEWDTAAGQAVLEAAGGRVVDAEGRPLTYGKPGFRNPGFVAWGAM
ncbi:3'(2'),5'-bisphosphate nucleotidase CysQ [Roseococcus sp. SDR]|uniref:3'(2'),5'-bisphosphate nucleotidase CysQ n=1 Tax=Roseococcus sp. SDR TaxID=2835532 RepID=UPI001BCAAE57|nr:3'(2'),5'-bisphosphate nucleotidase CysQ [Roseococcus sp. SDR]MBS7788898.1 3'(2'),5'-bisphosphate nucleotidase CysQ [Roseococcus sp. SDR]MBV1844212.1 3'(2'),5'-bisphosphate nucleotidase CysQ [Roseococcus sp. SDR]